MKYLIILFTGVFPFAAHGESIKTGCAVMTYDCIRFRMGIKNVTGDLTRVHSKMFNLLKLALRQNMIFMKAAFPEKYDRLMIFAYQFINDGNLKDPSTSCD